MAALDSRSLTALILEWVCIAFTIALALWFDSWWAMLPAAVIIATRQHALLILYHDAVHGHLARSTRTNDFIVNLGVGVPTLMPVEFYRPLHLAHHRKLGTEDDPEKQLLYAGQVWNYRPLRLRILLKQLLADLLVVNGIRTLAAWRRQHPLPRVRPATLALAGVWFAALGAWLVLSPRTALIALALWCVPLLTLTQLLQKLRSFAEHSGGPGVTPGWQDWTYSWRSGVLGRLTIWPYNINYHREHHQRPQLHWHQLPAVAGDALAGREFRRLLLNRTGS